MPNINKLKLPSYSHLIIIKILGRNINALIASGKIDGPILSTLGNQFNTHIIF